MEAGTYFLEVRGFSSSTTGSYSLEAAFAESDDGDDGDDGGDDGDSGGDDGGDDGGDGDGGDGGGDDGGDDGDDGGDDGDGDDRDGDDGDDHGDSRETATEVAVPSSTAGSLESSGDSDYFRIVLQQAATLELRTTGSVDTCGVLYWEDGRSINESCDGPDDDNFRIRRNLPTGTYFIKVHGYDATETGTYSLEVSSYDSGDNHSDFRETATEVAVPSSTAGNLEPSRDSDYFRIVLQQPATLELHTTGDTDTYGVLYREDGSSITENDDGGTANNFRITHNLAAGTYFLEVRGADIWETGAYTLEAAFPDSDAGDDDGDDHGDSRETATEVAIPSSTAGSLETSGDSDYFRIVLQQAATLELRTTSNLDTYGVLYRVNGSLITENDDGGTANNFRITHNLGAGTYFLEVRGYDSTDTGEYSLEATFADDA